ncbi:MAG: RecX family transcriptional regulator [Lentimicrobiaceae bacterium]|nr:RecX family transcriptional regulator [Lentimicrobiaceae bacterium]
MNATTKIRKFCAYQDRSIAEVRAKLKGYILFEEEIEDIINQLIEEDFLNDKRFAAHFVKSKLNAKGWGYSKIRFHLIQKGIAEDIIKDALSEVSEENWEEQLQHNIEKWKRSNELSPTTYPKLVRFLIAKGYKISEIMRNIKFFWALVVALLLQSCSPRYEIPSLKQHNYYNTQINQQSYMICVDTMTPTSILKATAYLIDNSEFTKPQQFRVVYKQRKTNAFLNGKNVSFSNSFIFYKPPVITEFPSRYMDTLFTTYQYKDVVYAQAEGYWESNFNTEEEIGKALIEGVIATFKTRKLDLKMDIFVPQNAGEIDRPLLLLIHGGAFYVGDKSQTAIVEACNYFASLGYTTASINYRLGFQPTKSSIERAGYVAIQDAHAAVRFLIAHANKYKIDPNYIFVGGSSAGGITSLNLAFMQNNNRPQTTYKSFLNKDLGNIESVGRHNNITFQVKSIANLWGAVTDLNILKNNEVSVLSYHATGDPIVPYSYDYPMQKIVKKLTPTFFTKMYGSKPIHEELKKLGYREKLVSIPSDLHNLWETKGACNANFMKIINNMKQFFYIDLVPAPIHIEHDIDFCQRYFIANIENVALNTWQCEGGFIINSNVNEAFVIWKTDATDRKLTTSGVYSNGAAFKMEIER